MSMTMQVLALTPEQVADFDDSSQALEDYLIANMFQVSERSINLEWTWHALDYYIVRAVGDTSVSQSPLMDGAGIGNDMGYGPARLLTMEDTKCFAAFLLGHPVETIEALFDFKQLSTAQIYPSIWDRKEDADRAAILTAYADLKAFVTAAANRNQTLLLVLS